MLLYPRILSYLEGVCGACRYQNRLHQNLIFLSYLADAQPDNQQ